MTITPRTVLLSILGTGILFVAAFMTLQAQESDPDKPMNVVFILSDDHRYDSWASWKRPLF